MQFLLFYPATEFDAELFEAIVLEENEYYSEQFAHGCFYLPVTGGGDADNLELALDIILTANNIQGRFDLELED